MYIKYSSKYVKRVYIYIYIYIYNKIRSFVKFYIILSEYMSCYFGAPERWSLHAATNITAQQERYEVVTRILNFYNFSTAVAFGHNELWQPLATNSISETSQVLWLLVTTNCSGLRPQKYFFMMSRQDMVSLAYDPHLIVPVSQRRWDNRRRRRRRPGTA